MLIRCLACLLVLLLAACGGGGGGGGDATPPAPAPTPEQSSASNDSANVDEESSVSIDVTANDERVDAGTLMVSISPMNGDATIDGSLIRYSPTADFSGTDSFQYSVQGDDGSTLTATVTVTVNNINDAPVAQSDIFVLVEDNILELTLAANDSDVDSAIESFVIVGSPEGTISGTGRNLTYTPLLDFVGEVSFSYRAVDAEGLESNEVEVTIDVVAVTATTIEVFPLEIPRSGYASGNDAELDTAVFASEILTFDVPPNAVSVLLSLNGGDVNINEGGLFISSIQSPSGLFPIYQRTVHFCFGGNCSGLIPRLPGYLAESGVWQYQVGTLAADVTDIDFDNLSLTATVRTGPTPDSAADRPAAFRIQPYLSATSVVEPDLQPVLSRLVELGSTNDLEFVIEPVDRLMNSDFEIVSSSFSDPVTGQMVTLGAADTINVFFVEDFADSETLGGISGGIPGGLGFQNGHNGVLINTSGFIFNETLQEENLAETTFHEIGHLLGLYHTTEAQFTHTDVLADTPECVQAIHDENGNGTANTTECPDVSNPMFWTRSALFDWEPLTDDQKHVLIHSPLAVPGS